MERKFYYLKGKTIMTTTSIWKYGEEMEKNYIVQQTTIGDVFVSTVFLGVDHRSHFSDPGPLILFETMIFGGAADQYQERYETYKQAEEGHKKACDMILQMVSLETEVLKKSIIKSLN